MAKIINSNITKLVLSVIVVLVGIFFVESYTNDPLLPSEHIHIAIEVLGAAIIIIMAIILTIYKYDWEYNMAGFILGFLLMGIVDIFHAIVPLGDQFVFLHSIAGIFGGIGILVTIIMYKLKYRKVINSRNLIIIFIIGILFSSLVMYFDGLIPTMVVDGEFTYLSIVINIAAGIMFLISACFFAFRYIKNKSTINLIFFSSTLYMSLGYITFQFAELWCISWWALHVLRLAAYVILFGLFIVLIEDNRKILENRKNEILDINKKLNEYTYIISHDLKEPIRSIRTFSEFVLEDYEASFDETGKDYFNRIIMAANKMALMIDDLLILSRIGKKDIEFKQIDFGNMLKEIEFDLSEKITLKNVNIHYTNLPAIICQPVWMIAAMTNLIGNAIKYSDESKESIEIDIKVDEDPKDHSKYKVAITDNGMGIDRSQFEKIFGLFRRAYSKNDKEGSGAGLAIVKSIIQEHGGDIWVEESELGVGTTICFTIKRRHLHNE